MDPIAAERADADASPPDHRPCPYRARAWYDEELVAESTGAVRVDEKGRGPSLYFPLRDVRLDRFAEQEQRVVCPVKGSGRSWRWDGPGGGNSLLWSFDEPAVGVEWLAPLAVFDHDRLRVELVDEGPDDEPKDVTVKRFPAWGDAADLIDILDVRPAGDGRFVTVTRGSYRRSVVEGSQMLAQAIVASGRHVPGRRPVSAHMVFMRVADAEVPLEVEVEDLSGGRTFTALRVDLLQTGRLCASGTILMDATAADVVRHRAEPPPVPGPYDSPSYDMSVMGRDVRVVDGAYSNDPSAPIGPPVIDAWVRFRRVPQDPYLQAGLLTQFTGHMSIAASLRPHDGVSQHEAHRSLSTAINAIGISLHAPVRADRWMLYHHHSTSASDGMTHSECRVHDREGGLVASFTVDAMVRRPAAPTPGRPERSAL